MQINKSQLFRSIALLARTQGILQSCGSLVMKILACGSFRTGWERYILVYLLANEVFKTPKPNNHQIRSLDCTDVATINFVHPYSLVHQIKPASLKYHRAFTKPKLQALPSISFPSAVPYTRLLAQSPRHRQ